MTLNFTDTIFVKSNEFCINLNTEKPAFLAGHDLKVPVKLKIISEPYKKIVEHNSKKYEEEFVNVTDNIHNYRVLKKHII